ncbi:MAG: nucleotide pyrophosphatase, partial [Moorea sp. SIO2I5]|nr:nucleotide pyrophosphatase [Moorena sp. SIO2I5]
MKTPVIAIGLDSAEPRLIEKWMSQGHLKNLSRLRKQGIYGRLNNTVDYAGVPTENCGTEASWVSFLTGCTANKTGYWGTVKYYPNLYKATENKADGSYGSYDFKEYPPFYALGDNYKVLTFDTQMAKKVD